MLSQAHVSWISTRAAVTKRRRLFVVADPELDGAALEFLLNEALDRVGGAQSPAVTAESLNVGGLPCRLVVSGSVAEPQITSAFHW
ncbi:hypothetical protein ASE49_08100 [Novosphingobium sp. Leaf2]|nr:hypothetical protein ASE49_08100 [Novosphingobium sp. Leaf2]